MPNEVRNHIEIHPRPAKKPGKRPPEKRLFHRPITPLKAAIYVLLALLTVLLVLAGRFIYVTVIDARAAFSDTPVVVTPPPASAPQASGAAATPQPTQTLSPKSCWRSRWTAIS